MPGVKRPRAQHDYSRSSTDHSADMTSSKRKADGDAPRAKKHKPAPNPATKKYQPKKYSLNPLKARIRDLRRQLDRTGEDMPANIRVDKERELQACEHELSVAEAERVKQDMIPRYHKVRFFERQKATRFLKKAVKRLNDNSDPEKHADLEREQHICEVDLNYTLYYPLIRPYVSLYATSKNKDDQDASAGTTRIGGDKEMWEIVEKRMRDGTLEALRNGLEWRQGSPRALATPVTAPAEKKATKAIKTTKAPTARATARSTSVSTKEDASDNESDGGFFE
ncbi:hypothetical protein B0J12DRAFT_741268 [Macrophomina phaseolina]|uniref:rRNA-processing protein EFG1 n=1 Tax=Macrophomina phaseolina TaxID=35725 RepID=A0ABQ8G7U2_9PEZI|nr:hypothetical protein B0J12DRAFT_741268 [Macrophomina phaseolina]